ncbi:hypothetical protein GmHk_12G033744 [Glycine max]|nr:hypothetical protein GmHk_12G033744 [Glycine max]
MQIQTRTMYDYNHIHMMMSSPASSPPTLGYIQHPISKLDKLAGIAIKALKCSENGSLFYRKSPMSPQNLSRHKKSHSLANGTLDDIMAAREARKSDSDKWNGTLIRRSYKSEAKLQRIPELLLKQDNNCNGGFSFSPRSANGLAQRQKSGSRIALTA